MKTIKYVSLLLMAITVAQTAMAEVEALVEVKPQAQFHHYQQILKHKGIKQERPVFSEKERRVLKNYNAELAQKWGNARVLVLDSQKTLSDLQTITTQKKLPLNIHVNPHAEIKSLNEDPLVKDQWALKNTGAQSTQTIATDLVTSVEIRAKQGEDLHLQEMPSENMVRKPIIVAVLDTGVSITHPDLQNQLLRKPEECKALEEFKSCVSQKSEKDCAPQFAGRDSDQNMYPMDCTGWSVTRNSLFTDLVGRPLMDDVDPKDSRAIPLDDPVGHGTHIAGIIGAQKNGIGIEGVLQNVKLLPVQVITYAPKDPGDVRKMSLDENNLPSVPSVPSPKEKNAPKVVAKADALARGLLYAIYNNVDIINMSLGWPAAADAPILHDFVKLAIDRGIFVVAAAGNDATDSLVYPCAYNKVICVGAHGPDGALAFFSNFGSGVDIAAPGLNILSSTPISLYRKQSKFTDQRGWDFKLGTSQATPYVSGAIARLLNAGVVKSEIYSRLLLGARPSQPASVQRKSGLTPYTLSGNLDITQAYKAKAQPLILPNAKEGVSISLKSGANRANISIALQNHWLKANAVNVKAKVVDRNTLSEIQQLRLTPSEWQFASLENQESQNLNAELQINDFNQNSEIAIQLEITANNAQTRVANIPADIYTELSLNDNRANNLTFENPDGETFDYIRTITAKDGKPTREYVGITLQPDTIHLVFMREQSGKVIVVGKSDVSYTEGDELADIIRIDIDQNGTSDYVLLFDAKPRPPAVFPGLQIVTLNSKFEPLELNWKGESKDRFEFAFTETRLNPNYNWMQIGKDRLTLAWVGMGYPVQANKKLDPWNPNKKDSPNIHMYYISPSGLNEVEAPKDFYFISNLVANSQQIKNGEAVVLLAKDENQLPSYYTATVKNAQISNLQKIMLPQFRTLNEVDVLPILGLQRQQLEMGNAFGGQPGLQNQKISLLANQTLQSYKLTPNHPLDFLRKVAAVFSGTSGAYGFVQSKYELHFFDLARGERANLNLKRFSFIADYDFDTNFYGVQIDGLNKNSERIPALLTPSGGISKSTNVVIPQYSLSQTRKLQLNALIRPISLRILPPAECTEINFIAATAAQPASTNYFCGDHFLQFPLKLQAK